MKTLLAIASAFFIFAFAIMLMCIGAWVLISTFGLEDAVADWFRRRIKL